MFTIAGGIILAVLILANLAAIAEAAAALAGAALCIALVLAVVLLWPQAVLVAILAAIPILIGAGIVRYRRIYPAATRAAQAHGSFYKPSRFYLVLLGLPLAVLLIGAAGHALGLH
jgi:hypothetical protein